jgi:hypothetical protein
MSAGAPAVSLSRPAPERVAAKSAFIVNALYDYPFFIFAPLLALAIGIAISRSPFSQEQVTVFGHRGSITNIFIGAFIFAHLVIVFFRSHGNQKIFRLHRWRFTAVPITLFAAMLLSKWVLISVAVLAVWWDVYHSALQTFGLGRIYDARRGNNPVVGRRLDLHLNLLLYAGPILGGVTLVDHMDSFDKFSELGSVLLTSIPAYASAYQRWLTWGVLLGGGAFLLYYLAMQWTLRRQGYAVSPQKVLLYVSTAACSIYTWGFNSFGEAFFIMNFFHALQYFALVWWSEQQNMQRLFRLSNVSWGKPAALVVYLTLAFAYGLWAEVSDSQNRLVLSVILVVSIMHFWYDGFIWSVRKKQI